MKNTSAVNNNAAPVKDRIYRLASTASGHAVIRDSDGAAAEFLGRDEAEEAMLSLYQGEPERNYDWYTADEHDWQPFHREITMFTDCDDHEPNGNLITERTTLDEAQAIAAMHSHAYIAYDDTGGSDDEPENKRYYVLTLDMQISTKEHQQCTCTCEDCEKRGVHYCHNEDASDYGETCNHSAFEIAFKGFTDGDDAMGYCAENYFDVTPPADFPTQEAAESWIRQHHLGPDDYGVDAKFCVIRTGLEGAARSLAVLDGVVVSK